MMQAACCHAQVSLHPVVRQGAHVGDWEAGAQRDAQDPGLAAEGLEDDDAAGDFDDMETGIK